MNTFNNCLDVVKIGNQEWMTANLNVEKFRNGDPIPEARSDGQWQKACEYKRPAWCYYSNSLINGKQYGKLYNWYSVNDPRGLAPVGWHIPSHKEWTALTDYLGGEEFAGTKMKSTIGWKENGNGTNSSGFTGLPGGRRHWSGTFSVIGKCANWWSSTENDISKDRAWSRILFYLSDSVVSGGGLYANLFYTSNKWLGYSVRCIKD